MADGRNDDDKVGFCKPPKHSQFKKGASGNPKGRPRKLARIPSHSEIDRLLNDVCGTVEVGGRRRAITGREALFRGMIKDAMRSPAGMARLLKYEKELLIRALAARSKEGSSNIIQFIFPAIMPMDDWEAIAVPMQAKLLAEVRL